jgi:mono/diheme cytochrome c family protein
VASTGGALVLAGIVFAVGFIGWHRTASQVGRESARSTAPRTAAAPGASGSVAGGKAVFGSAGCGSCHALRAAGSHGSVAPDLDRAKPDAAYVRDLVTNGAGAMPSFKDRLTRSQIRDVAAFVASSAGR